LLCLKMCKKLKPLHPADQPLGRAAGTVCHGMRYCTPITVKIIVPPTPLFQQGRAGHCVGKILYSLQPLWLSHLCRISLESSMAGSNHIYLSGREVCWSGQAVRQGREFSDKGIFINLLILFFLNHCAFYLEYTPNPS
jgi:hypothetical protein